MSKLSATVTNRSCRYCKAKFKPERKDQRFCKPAHRKSFWKYGGLNFDKMKEQIMKDVRKMVREELISTVNQVWGKDIADIGAWQRAATESAALHSSPAAQRASR